MKKVICVLAVGVMALSSLPVLGVSAEETYALGDVDMDGIVTGHDTAMVSRYVLDDTYTLTEEQLQLADVNGDGEVNQADADMLYNEMQMCVLGSVTMGQALSMEDALIVLTHYTKQCAGLEDEWSQIQENLADVDLNGVVNTEDLCYILTFYGYQSAGYPVFFNEGQYYFGYVSSTEETYALGDVDMDGIVTGHDTAMVSRYVLDDTYTLTEKQLKLADVNEDSEVNQADADLLYNEMQEYALGCTTMKLERSFLSIEDAVDISTYCQKQRDNLEYNWTQVQKNLADVNLDGVVDLVDACGVLKLVGRQSAAMTIFENEGQYYIANMNVVYLDDMTDIWLNGGEHDTAYIDAEGRFFYNG